MAVPLLLTELRTHWVSAVIAAPPATWLLGKETHGNSKSIQQTALHTTSLSIVRLVRDGSSSGPGSPRPPRSAALR